MTVSHQDFQTAALMLVELTRSSVLLRRQENGERGHADDVSREHANGACSNLGASKGNREMRSGCRPAAGQILPRGLGPKRPSCSRRSAMAANA